ncbi:MAG: orotidine 5'-phosphate decarboxylase [Candidatus Thermoplasmatota archaeon]|jgi:3-hexulose-6-phosphate synthase/6-phospho-3-hexuloisomerase|nr:orotidine 5'-phosphate decarboxylase [Candidatus Thermoplasmatota archaeon]
MDEILQVALDLENLPRAIEIGRAAVEGGADWIEAGTPFIKSEGMNGLRTLKKEFRGKTIVADMKIMDVGAFEAAIAAKAGADIITVLSVAAGSTIYEGVESAKQYGARIMVDLIGSSNLEEAIKTAEKAGASYVCVHVGIDEQMDKKDPFAILKRVAELTDLPVAVAGGINSETAPLAIENGASIVIVGGAIIKAIDVKEATQTIKKAMATGRAIQSDLFKRYKENDILTAFMKVSTPNISDAMHRKGAMHGIIPFIEKGVKIAGRAVTVITAEGDWAKPVEAIDKAKAGEVIVIDAAGKDTAVWGELASWSALTKGVKGVVIDGAVRDIDSIKAINFPVFARYAVPHAGEPKGFGEINIEILCGGQRVRMGDWIVGDENGVVVIPAEQSVEIANRAVDVLERENRLREEIKKGGTLSSIQRLEEWEKVG